MSTTRAQTPSITIPTSGRYQIDPIDSSIALRIKHFFGLGHVAATVGVLGGEILVNGAPEASRVQAAADAASFNSGNSGRDKIVLAKRLLDTDRYPDFTFVSHSLAQVDGLWVVRGTLSVRGQSAALDLRITDFARHPIGISVAATGTVDRYAFGITGLKGFIGRYADVTINAIASPLPA